ncbi:bifunctional diaminohydroxyphosphoribosylaminopyrimidine deaminase/5-amino-6-(5-phosphoribosylamino)uracil reductase RibD [Sphingomicrobium sediminis]|uniref:Riboflavin biosynthesis protein RibD n=1 Tax=Sphingomicrobium sediminis TaxID=2950949 RepID=A0A9X2EMH7_9SPHN|nr:bifunctional diaminohydroxyphosphoribosylaminopyrimidine deaminase/5-amino-6-(5-phosphoribosylamino)uracil reductase RibD [Sphingomicrobium sediminis]MCM8558124.1 bifunctional diaminohydroxyphosphoribosylaminopyrimidine deaminase/5-amino-6-(5-phosphoribosylamino)uracil reductase RibD [Sphingomicrobium sediminis]
MARAVELGEAARGTTAPNPAVGCVIVKDEQIVGEGATAAGGRPHAEKAALDAAGAAAKGATLYTTLEPCAHDSERGPTCAAIIPEAGISEVVIACADPDPRTAGSGIEMLRAAGIDVRMGPNAAAARSLSGYLTRIMLGRPRVTLKLALSIDGKIALPSGESKWLTGEDARAHVHAERASADMILVGRGTYEADQPRLDVRLPGLEDKSPARALLSRTAEPLEGWTMLRSPTDIMALPVNDLLVEGGSGVATAFLAEDLVDRILIYRAPILIGEGQSSIGYIGLDKINDAHGRWRAVAGEALGIDRLEVYERLRDLDQEG